LNQLYIILTLGPYGEQDDQQVFIQKVVPETDKLFVRLSSNGQRYVVIVISYYSNNWQKTTYMFGMLSTVLLYFIFLIYIMKHKIKINKEGKSFEHLNFFLNQNEMNNNIRIWLTLNHDNVNINTYRQQILCIVMEMIT
jgi:hypothetical protein